ncbi:peptidyl-tyrosine sulfation [Homalodisca vitripennis]|nr:peptidyl-tyrosine sulfation [Homalodisca vitripennis]
MYRCGPDTRIIPRVLQMYHQWLTDGKEHRRLLEAGVDSQVLQAAVSALCLEVLVHHGDFAPLLCNKDPLTFQYAVYLSELFPRAKFLLVVRDGRAAVHSIISRQIHVARYDLKSYQSSISQWNNATDLMLDQCQLVGPSRCRVLHYEMLVLSPRRVLDAVLRFLEVPWDENVLHHESLVGKPGGIKLSRFEYSSAEVRRAIHKDSLNRWVGRFPEEVLRDLPRLAPVLSRLGYDPADSVPDYGTLAETWDLDSVFLASDVT